MKKFVGISSILLLSSVLANTGVSLASAAETKEEAKVVDTTKEKNEKKSSSDDASDSSTEEKNARDIASTSTEESSAIEDVDGTAMLQDPTKDLLDKITESTKEENSEEKASKEDKEKGDKDSKEVKDKKISPLMKDARAGWGWKQDFTWKNVTIQGQTIQVITGLSSTGSQKDELTILGYYDTSLGDIYPVAIADNVFKGNKNIKKLRFETRSFGYDDYQARLCTYDTKHHIWQYTTDGTGIFSGMSNLQNIDLQGLNTSSITNFNSMFQNDIKLSTVQLDGLDVSNGVTFISMFDGCQSLISIDLSSWRLNRAGNMSSMFANCRNLIEAKIDGLPNGVHMRDMFHNAPVVYAELKFSNPRSLAGNVENIFLLDKQFNYLPLVIYSNSQTFLNTKSGQLTEKYYTYDSFAGDARTLPFILVSGKGLFTQTIKPSYPSRFDVGSVENHDEKICMLQGITNGFATNKDPMNQLSNPKATIQKVIGDVKPYPTIQDNQMPPKDDQSRFYAGYYDDETKQRMNGWHKVFDSAPTYLKNIFAKVTAQYSPVNPEMSKGHTVDSKNPTSKDWPDNRMPQGPLGFAYQPSTLTADNMELDGKEKHTSLTSDGQTAFHLGVRDYTQTPSPWTVSARLSWNDKPMNQATIQASGGGIKLNMNSLNNNTNKPKPFKDSQLNNYGKTNVQSLISSGMTLSNGQMIQIMKADGQQDRAFYDLTLGNLTLNVPDDSKLQPKSYQGQIDWNLTTGPNGN